MGTCIHEIGWRIPEKTTAANPNRQNIQSRRSIQGNSVSSVHFLEENIDAAEFVALMSINGG